MNRTATLVVAGFLLVNACGGGSERPKKNLVLVTMDTTRSDFMSFLGADARITPNLDALAERSVVFTNARSETNVTNPSHLTIHSGLPAIRHGVLDNMKQIPAGIDTLASALHRLGYRTAAFVSARNLGHLIGWPDFDTFPEVDSRLSATEVTNAAVAWLDAHGEGPFFLWVHYYDPHTEYDPPYEIQKEFYPGDPTAGDGPPLAAHPYFGVGHGVRLAKWLGNTRDPAFPRALYAGEIHYVDQQLGRLLGRLERAPRAGNTTIVVTADHGESLDEHGIFYAHRGLYEPQLRIPLLIHDPDVSGGRRDEDVSTMDVVPTLAELLGFRMEHEPPGLSLVPLLHGERTTAFADRDVHVYQNASNHAVAVRRGSWKLILGISDDHYLLSRPPQLFDLASDPGETINIAPLQPELIEELRAIAGPWLRYGAVEGEGEHLSEQDWQQLRALGYADF